MLSRAAAAAHAPGCEPTAARELLVLGPICHLPSPSKPLSKPPIRVAAVACAIHLPAPPGLRHRQIEQLSRSQGARWLRRLRLPRPLRLRRPDRATTRLRWPAAGAQARRRPPRPARERGERGSDRPRMGDKRWDGGSGLPRAWGTSAATKTPAGSEARVPAELVTHL